MTKLKIEMVHDIVCSWCPIGYSNIQKAIDNLGIEVDFHFLPFELNPQMSAEGERIASYFKRIQGWDSKALQDYQTGLVKTASKAGVVIDFTKRTHYYNTKNAHKLIHWAEKFNKQSAVNESLINAYFTQGQDISDIKVLLNIAEQLGLDRILTESALSSEQLAQELEMKFKRQRIYRVRSIPVFILNEDVFLAGSHSVEFFEKTLSESISN
jgi:predicted DsbA family dithiol-disulfide isomerase